MRAAVVHSGVVRAAGWALEALPAPLLNFVKKTQRSVSPRTSAAAPARAVLQDTSLACCSPLPSVMAVGPGAGAGLAAQHLPFRSEGGGGGSDSSAEPPRPCPAACPAPRVPAAPCPCCLGTDGSCVGSPGELPHATGAWLLSSARLCSRPSHGAWCARALSQRLGVFCERSSQLLREIVLRWC